VQGNLISFGPPPTYTLHELVISSGIVSGADGALNASEWGYVSPDITNYGSPGGFTTKANIFVNVTVVIPEPGMLAMLGSVLGLVGAMSARLGRRRS
jgi:hypothetical protein